MELRSGASAASVGLLVLLLAAAPAAARPPADAQPGSSASPAGGGDASACDASGPGRGDTAGTEASSRPETPRGWGAVWLDESHPGRVHRHGSMREPPPAHGLGLPDGDCTATSGSDVRVLVDEDGLAVAELGEAQADGAVRDVPVQTPFAEPVVVVGPATARDAEPGVVRVPAAAADGFQVRFQEWDYLDGLHAAEDVPYLVVESGRHVLSDGSVWEAGTVEAEGGVWRRHLFEGSFPEPPALLLSVQSADDGDAVAVRARAVGTDGFEVALFEQEASAAAHAPERVGYLAVRAPARSGRIATRDGGSVPYLARRVEADERRLPVLSTSLWIAEEQSADDELDHDDELVDVLAVGPAVFAQDVAFRGDNPFAVRRAPPRHAAALEWGTLPDLDQAWQTVPLARTYERPVVVVRPLSHEGGDPALLRIRNVAGDGFETRVQEWKYLDDVHVFERAFYMVAETGIQALGELVVEAGTLEGSNVLAEGWDEVVFHAPFPDTPALFGSVMSLRDADPVIVRIAARTPSGFLLTMQEEEASTDGHLAENLGWIAVQRGRTVTSDGRTVLVFDSSGDAELRRIDFGEALRGRFPFLLAQLSSAHGEDPGVLRYETLNPDDVFLFLDEETSNDAETGHLIEDFSLLVAE